MSFSRFASHFVLLIAASVSFSVVTAALGEQQAKPASGSIAGGQGAAGAKEGDSSKDLWKAGFATENITPRVPVVLFGYPDRSGTSTSIASEIFAKALALEDAAGNRGVIVTLDLVGIQAAMTTDRVSALIQQKTGLERRQIIFNASHSHTGPVISLRPNLKYNVSHPDMSEEDAQRNIEYTKTYHDKLVNVVVRALADLKPARLTWGRGTVAFPISRRMPTAKGLVVMQANPKGVVDRTVPVLRVDTPDGKLRGMLFGASCHNVAAGQLNAICGDYAGFAQTELEARYPGTQAMFMQGCGADANPQPWGSLDLAKSHGRELAAAVIKVVEQKLAPVRPTLATEFAMVDFPLSQFSRKELEAYLPLPNFQARTAKHMLEVLDRGVELPKVYAAPIGAWQLGALRLAVLPGEPVAEYVGLLEQKLGPDNLWIAGFNNDCFGYLPTAKVIAEGGHEAIGITLWSCGQMFFDRVGFYAPGVQEVVVDTVVKLATAAEVDAKRQGP